MAKEIMLVYTCNIWKNTDSMSLCLATTDIQRIGTAIRKGIKEDVFNYSAIGSEASKRAQMNAFKEYWDTYIGDAKGQPNESQRESLCHLNDCMDYVFIDVVEDGYIDL